jgi:hypothetical protein
MTTSSEHPANNPAGPAADPPPGAVGAPALPDDADREGEVDVLHLAEQRPGGAGEWLLITAVDGRPGGDFLARVLPVGGRCAHGGDVLIRLTDQTAHLEPTVVSVSAWVVIRGLLIPVATWDQKDLDDWPERTRATVAFAMGMLTELEEHGADLGAGERVELDAAAATAGVPAGVTFGSTQSGAQPGP